MPKWMNQQFKNQTSLYLNGPTDFLIINIVFSFKKVKLKTIFDYNKLGFVCPSVCQYVSSSICNMHKAPKT